VFIIVLKLFQRNILNILKIYYTCIMNIFIKVYQWYIRFIYIYIYIYNKKRYIRDIDLGDNIEVLLK
jgi:hypothetical protein